MMQREAAFSPDIKRMGLEFNIEPDSLDVGNAAPILVQRFWVLPLLSYSSTVKTISV